MISIHVAPESLQSFALLRPSIVCCLDLVNTNHFFWAMITMFMFTKKT